MPFFCTLIPIRVLYRLKGNPVKFRSGPAAVILIPLYIGVSAFAGEMPLFISEWEGWQRSGEPEDLPVNSGSMFNCSTFDVAVKNSNTEHRTLNVYAFPRREARMK